MFITFEGIEGSGKSTQCKLLKEYLEGKGRKVSVTREPGWGAMGKLIRNLILEEKDMDIHPFTELCLFCADRVQHVKDYISPRIEEGEVVICDRYFDSTTAYQGYGRGIDLEFVNALIKETAKKLWPDLTFLVDVDADLAEKRSGTIGHPDRLEMEAKEFKIRVIEGFKKIAKREPERFIILDGNESVETIADEAWKHTSMLLSSRSQSQLKHGQNA